MARKARGAGCGAHARREVVSQGPRPRRACPGPREGRPAHARRGGCRQTVAAARAGAGPRAGRGRLLAARLTGPRTEKRGASVSAARSSRTRPCYPFCWDSIVDANSFSLGRGPRSPRGGSRPFHPRGAGRAGRGRGAGGSCGGTAGATTTGLALRPAPEPAAAGAVEPLEKA